MLQLIFKLGQALNNALSFFALLLVGHVAHGAMKIVDRAGLSRKIQSISINSPYSENHTRHFVLTRITGHLSWAET